MAMVKQRILILLALLFVVFRLGIEDVYAEDYRDKTDDIEISDPYINEIVTIYAKDDSYNKEEVAQMIERLSALPLSIKKESVNEFIELHLIDFPIPQLKGYEYLEDERPRGHPEGSTWNDVTGMSIGSLAVAKIGYSFPNMYSGTILLEYHELFHAIDEVILGDNVITEQNEFKLIHEEEHDKLEPGEDYYSYIEEYFAEAAAYYYRGGEYRELLRERAPKTFRYFQAFADRIIVIEEKTDGKIELSWNGNNSAVYYDIYRNDELIGTTSGHVFIDTSFDSYDDIEYRVEGVNVDDDIIYSTLNKQLIAPDNERIIIDKPDVKIDKQTGDSVTLKWNAPNYGDYYEIYRNGRLIGETKEIKFKDSLEEADLERAKGEFEYEIKVFTNNGSEAKYNPIVIEFEEEEELEEEPEQDETETDNEEEDEETLMQLYYVLGAVALIIVIVIVMLFIKRKENTES